MNETATMNQAGAPDAHGVLTGPTTLTIKRMLPGPIERCFAYLTESDLRRQWLAAGEMEMRVGAEFELTWRNDELTDPPGTRPAGFGAEHRMASRITALDPPRKLAFTWGEGGGEGGGEVAIELTPVGGKVLMTLVHTRLADRSTQLNVSAGWHAHLDVLAARMEARDAGVFWDDWAGLKAEYERLLPG